MKINIAKGANPQMRALLHDLYMGQRVSSRRKLVSGVGAAAVTAAILATPAGRGIVRHVGEAAYDTIVDINNASRHGASGNLKYVLSPTQLTYDTTPTDLAKYLAADSERDFPGLVNLLAQCIADANHVQSIDEPLQAGPINIPVSNDNGVSLGTLVEYGKCK